MKKLVLMLTACAVFAACQQNGKSSANAEGTDSTAVDSTATLSGDSLVYEGEGPAADGTYKYSLKLFGDSTQEFAYEETAVTPKGTETMARTTGLTAFYENGGKKYIRVQQNGEDSVTFLQLDETTLRLVSNDFIEAGKGTNTDLKLKK